MTRSLQVEIKQTAPFVSPEQEVFLNLIRTAATLEYSLEESFKPYGLTLTQYNALRILRGAGKAGLCRREVQERMIRPVTDVTRLLDRLEEVGLVGRCRDSSDRRYIAATITKRGIELLDLIDGHLADMHQTQLGHMARSELRQLADLLAKARARA
jgi:DNA-binding MarR family transcriptional regulator